MAVNAVVVVVVVVAVSVAARGAASVDAAVVFPSTLSV